MSCPICGYKKTFVVAKKFQGFVQGTYFDIYHCNRCYTRFIHVKHIDQALYDLIYGNNKYGSRNTSGYDRYLRYAKQVKKEKDPLRFLSDEESSFFPVHWFFKAKPDGGRSYDLLDVGCGYGYLTYALNSLGHGAVGIDVSAKVIRFAKAHFGSHFFKADLKSYKSKEGYNKKYDIIIATELIEHLEKPREFIEECLRLLKKDGRIIISTPNMDYYRKRVWGTELPPVHTLWLSRKSFEHLAQEMNVKVEFVDYHERIGKRENDLIEFLLSKKEITPLPAVDKQGKPCAGRIKIIESPFRKAVRKIILSYPVRYAAHKITNLISSEPLTLGVILQKK